MNIPADLQKMYEHCLNLATDEVEKMSVSPEFLLALIERIGDLETDSVNLESYIHYECKRKNKIETERADNLAIDIEKLKQNIVNDASQDIAAIKIINQEHKEEMNHASENRTR